MADLVIPLDQISIDDVSRVGVKGAISGALLKAGFPVPSGWCVSVKAFQLALKSLDGSVSEIQSVDRGQPSEAARTARLPQVLERLEIPPEVMVALDAISDAMDPHGSLAVRSSAVAEDRPEASFAGQYSTALGISGREALREAILSCWRSYFSANALAMRASLGLPQDSGMAVLIQPVIQAECAGVCFSLDPVQPHSETAVISAAWGLGLGVVDGTLAADTAWVHRYNFAVKEHRVVEKTAQSALGPEGDMITIPTPDERRRAACLPEAWLIRIAQFGLAAEALLGLPQDMEWAIADGQVWVLQSRPIASLPQAFTRKHAFPLEWVDEAERRSLWIVSHPSGRERDVLLPLERCEIASVQSMREETCRFLGVDRNQRLQVVNGRIYVTPAPLLIGDGDRRIRQEAFRDLAERLWAQDLTTWDYWGPEIIKATERLAAFDPADASSSELAEHLENALAAYRRHWMLHPMCSFKLRREYVAAFEQVSGLTGAAAEMAAFQLVESNASVLTRLMDDVYGMAHVAQSVPALAAFVADPKPGVWDRLSEIPGSVEFRALLERFMEEYGDRTGSGWGSEATVMTPTWREQPEQVLRLVALFLTPGTVSPQAARWRARQERDARVAVLCQASSSQAADEFKRQLAYACRQASVLEDHNHYIDQLSVGQLRRAVLAAADWLVARGSLEDRDDVFWLGSDEILQALREETPGLLLGRIASRQGEHAVWLEMDTPPVLGVPDSRLPARPPLRDEAEQYIWLQSGMIKGLGASPGRSRGRARVILDPTRLPDFQPGDILVAENVGPLWTPFFPTLSGLVLDGGSLGQHAAATAREYGIPAVVDTRISTRHIQDGDWVMVDGTVGTVEIQR